MSAAELIDNAIVLAKRHFWLLLRLGFFPIIGATTLSYFARSFGAFTSLRGAACLISAYGLMALAEAATISGAWHVLQGWPVDGRTVWLSVGQRAESVVAAYVLKSVMLSLGFVLLLVPGLYLVSLYFAVPGVNAIEGLGVRASFARSRALARGELMRIFRSYGLFWIVTLAIGLVLGRWLHPLGVPLAVVRVVSPIWVLLVTPFRAALVILVYADIRTRKEGYDLELALSSLPAAV
jgi:hypothetical protein